MTDGAFPGRPADLEAMAAILEASGRYRVLRRLEPRSQIRPADGSPLRLGVMLDLETTGLSAAGDEIIEMALLPFTYSLDGRIFEVKAPFHRLRQPSRPIPQEITRLTGLDDAAVAGCAIDPEEVERFMAPADLVIAHNAAFDRAFAERFHPVFAAKPWACSMSQPPWAEEGFEGTRLSYLAAGFGLFYDAHRALNDCAVVIELLARPMPVSGRLPMALLLEAARRPAIRIFADGAPFDMREALKARGYRWSGDAVSRPRTWYLDAPEETAAEEFEWLEEALSRSGRRPSQLRITAYERFSERI